MKIPNSRGRDDLASNQSMTPMIDVVFLLLIFFVCAAAGIVRESILPADIGTGSIESAEDIQPRERPFGEIWLFVDYQRDGPTTVQVNKGGQVFADPDELRETLLLLAETTTEIPVILDIAPTVPYGDLIEVYDACYEANFASVQFATDAAIAP